MSHLPPSSGRRPSQPQAPLPDDGDPAPFITAAMTAKSASKFSSCTRRPSTSSAPATPAATSRRGSLSQAPQAPQPVQQAAQQPVQPQPRQQLKHTQSAPKSHSVPPAPRAPPTATAAPPAPVTLAPKKAPTKLPAGPAIPATPTRKAGTPATPGTPRTPTVPAAASSIPASPSAAGSGVEPRAAPRIPASPLRRVSTAPSADAAAVPSVGSTSTKPAASLATTTTTTVAPPAPVTSSAKPKIPASPLRRASVTAESAPSTSKQPAPTAVVDDSSSAAKDAPIKEAAAKPKIPASPLRRTSSVPAGPAPVPAPVPAANVEKIAPKKNASADVTPPPAPQKTAVVDSQVHQGVQPTSSTTTMMSASPTSTVVTAPESSALKTAAVPSTKTEVLTEQRAASLLQDVDKILLENDTLRRQLSSSKDREATLDTERRDIERKCRMLEALIGSGRGVGASNSVMHPTNPNGQNQSATSSGAGGDGRGGATTASKDSKKGAKKDSASSTKGKSKEDEHGSPAQSYALATGRTDAWRSGAPASTVFLSPGSSNMFYHRGTEGTDALGPADAMPGHQYPHSSSDSFLANGQGRHGAGIDDDDEGASYRYIGVLGDERLARVSQELCAAFAFEAVEDLWSQRGELMSAAQDIFSTLTSSASNALSSTFSSAVKTTTIEVSSTSLDHHTDSAVKATSTSASDVAGVALREALASAQRSISQMDKELGRVKRELSRQTATAAMHAAASRPLATTSTTSTAASSSSPLTGAATDSQRRVKPPLSRPSPPPFSSSPSHRSDSPQSHSAAIARTLSGSSDDINHDHRHRHDAPHGLSTGAAGEGSRGVSGVAANSASMSYSSSSLSYSSFRQQCLCSYEVLLQSQLSALEDLEAASRQTILEYQTHMAEAMLQSGSDQGTMLHATVTTTSAFHDNAERMAFAWRTNETIATATFFEAELVHRHAIMDQYTQFVEQTATLAAPMWRIDFYREQRLRTLGIPYWKRRETDFDAQNNAEMWEVMTALDAAKNKTGTNDNRNGKQKQTLKKGKKSGGDKENDPTDVPEAEAFAAAIADDGVVLARDPYDPGLATYLAACHSHLLIQSKEPELALDADGNPTSSSSTLRTDQRSSSTLLRSVSGGTDGGDTVGVVAGATCPSKFSSLYQETPKGRADRALVNAQSRDGGVLQRYHQHGHGDGDSDDDDREFGEGRKQRRFPPFISRFFSPELDDFARANTATTTSSTSLQLQPHEVEVPKNGLSSLSYDPFAQTQIVRIAMIAAAACARGDYSGFSSGYSGGVGGLDAVRELLEITEQYKRAIAEFEARDRERDAELQSLRAAAKARLAAKLEKKPPPSVPERPMRIKDPWNHEPPHVGDFTGSQGMFIPRTPSEGGAGSRSPSAGSRTPKAPTTRVYGRGQPIPMGGQSPSADSCSSTPQKSRVAPKLPPRAPPSTRQSPLSPPAQTLTWSGDYGGAGGQGQPLAAYYPPPTSSDDDDAGGATSSDNDDDLVFTRDVVDRSPPKKTAPRHDGIDWADEGQMLSVAQVIARAEAAFSAPTPKPSDFHDTVPIGDPAKVAATLRHALRTMRRLETIDAERIRARMAHLEHEQERDLKAIMTGEEVYFAALEFWKKVTVEGQRREDALEALTYRRDRMRTMGYAAVIPRPEIQEMLDQSGVLPTGKDRGGWVLLDFAADGAKHELDPKLFTPIETPTITSRPSRPSTPVSRSTPVVPTDRPMSRRSSSVDLVPDPAARGPVHVTTESNVRALQKELTTAHGTIDSLQTRIQKLLAELQTERGEKATLMLASQKTSRLEREAADFARAQKAKRAARRSEGVLCESEYDNLALLSGSDHLIRASNRNDDDDDDDVENSTSQRGPTKFVEIVIRNLGRQADVTWSAVSDAADIAYESLLEQKKAHEAWTKQRAKDRVTEYRYWRMKSLGTNVAVVCRAGTQTEMTSASTSIAAVTEFSTLAIREQEADVPALISQRQQQILNEAAGIDSPPMYECPLASVPNQEAIRKRQQVEEQKKKSFFSFLSRDSKKKSPSAKPQSGSGHAFADGSVSTRSSGQISSSTEQQCAGGGMICGACGATVRYNAETHASAFSAYGPVMTPLSMPGAHRFASSAAIASGAGATPRHPMMMHNYGRSSVAASAAGTVATGTGAGAGGKVPMCECGLPLGHVVYFGSASCTGVAETCFAEGAENPTAAVQSGGRPPNSARVGAGVQGLKTPRGMTAATDDGRGSAQTCSASAVTSGSGGSHGGPSAAVVEPWMSGGGAGAHRRPGPIVCVSDDEDAVSRDSVSDSSDASSDRDHDQATSAAPTPNKTPATPHSDAPGSTLLKTASGAVFVSTAANHSASKKPPPKPPTFRSNCRGCFDLYAVVGKQHQDLADAVVAQEVAVRHARAAAAQSVDDAKNRAESSVDFSFTAALFEGLEDSIRSALMSHQQSEFEMLCFVDDVGEKMCRELAQVNLRGYQYHRMKSLGFMVDPPLPVYSENVAVQTAIGATGQSDETLEAALAAMDQLKKQLETAQAKITGLEAAEQKRIEAGTTVPEAQLAVATKALEQEQARTGILAVQLAEAADRVASAESERLENELRLREATEKLGLVRDQLHLCEGQLQSVRSAEGDELDRTRAEMSELKLQLATISAERDERMDHQAKNIQAFALGTSNIDEVASEAARDLGVARRVIAAVEQDKAQLLDRLSEHERRMVGHARDLYQAKCERDAARDESAGLRRDLVRSQDVSAQLSAQIESLERSVALSESRAAKERTLKAQAVASITDAELKASILASKVSLYEAIDHEALVAARKDYAKLRAKERRIEERKAGRKLGSRAPTAAADADADAAKPAQAEKPGLFRRLFRKKVEDEKLNNAPRSSDDDDDDHHRRDGDTRTNSHVDPNSMVGNESLTAAAAEAIDGAAPSGETPDSAVADEEVCLSPDNAHPTRLVTMHALSAERPETFDPMTLAVARLEDARDEIARLRRKLALTRRKLSEHVDIQASQEGQASLHLQALEAALKASDSARVAAEEELTSARELATVSERQARAAMLKAQVAEQEVNDLLQQAVDQKRTALHGDAHHHANDSGGANSSGELPPGGSGGGGANTTEDSLADLSASPSGRSSVASIRGAKLSEKAPRIPLSPTFTAKNAAGAAAGAAGASRHVQHPRPRVPARMNSGVGANANASGSADRTFAGGDSPPRFPEKESSLGASLTDSGPATRTTAQHHRRVSSTGLSDRSAGGGGGDVAALRSALETAEQQIQQLRDEQKDRRRKAKVELREEVMRRRRYLARRRGEQQIAVANVAARTHVKIRRAEEEPSKTAGAEGADERSQRIDEAHAAAGLTALAQRSQTDADASSSKKRHTFSAIPTHGDKPKGPAVPRTPSVRRTSVDANATASAVGNVGSASGNKSDTEGYIQPSKKRKPGTSNANANNATNNDDDETDIASDTAIASDSAISGGSDGGGAGDGSAAERRMHAVPSKPTSRVLGRRVNPPPANPQSKVGATTGAATTGAQSNAGAAQGRGRGLQSMSDSEGSDLRLPLPRAVPKTTAEGRVVVGRVPKNKIGSLLRGSKPALAPTGDRSFCSEDEIDLDAEIIVDGDTPFEMNTGRLMGASASAASDSDAAGGVGLRGSGSGGPHALHHIVTSRPQSQAAYEQELRLDDIEADRELVAVRVKEALRQGGPGNSRTMAEQNKDLRAALQELYELHEETFGAARGERLALVEELEAATVQAQVLSHAVRAHVTSQVGYDTPDVATPRSELY